MPPLCASCPVLVFLCILALAASASPAAAQLFGPRLDLETGPVPRDIEVADLDSSRLVTNVSSRPILSIPLSGTAFHGTPGPTWQTAIPVTLALGASQTLTSRYARAIGGSASGVVQRVTNAPSAPALTLTPAGFASQELSAGNLDPSSIGFGTFPVGVTVDRQVWIIASGSVPLSVLGFANSSPDISVPGAVPFPVFGSAQFTVRFRPSSTGVFVDTLRVLTDATTEPVLKLPLSANVLPPPVLAVDPGTIDPIELQYGQVDSRAIVLRNLGAHWPLTGSATVSIDSILSPPPGDPVVVGYPQQRLDGEAHLWDVGADGSILSGDPSAFAGGADWTDFPTQSTATLENGGRTIRLGPTMVGEIELTRKVHVSVDGAWARFLDTARNQTATTRTYRPVIISHLFPSQAGITRTSSGDGYLQPAVDDWAIVQDEAGPVIAHVFAGPGGAQRPEGAEFGFPLQNVKYDYKLVLAPGASASVLHFALQAPTLELAMQRAEALRTPTADAMIGLSSNERARITNFALPRAISLPPSQIFVPALLSQPLAVNFDAGAGAAEERVYGSLRLATNDPLQPLRIVPLELSILGSVPDVLDTGPTVALVLGARFVPNPAVGRGVRLAYSLPTAGEARFELYDVRGRRVASRLLADAAPGPGTLDWSGSTTDGGGVALAPGVYWTRLTHGGRSVITKGVVLR